SDTAVVLVGHGSRDGGANAEFEAVADAYRAARPDFDVGVGYIELARPLLAEALEKAARTSNHVVVVPLLLFAAGHVKNDLPLAVSDLRLGFPGVRFDVAPALGVHAALAELAYARAASAVPADEALRRRTLLLVVGRGSSDPDANGDFCKMA